MTSKFKPLFNALDTFMFEPRLNTSKGPHIRDAVDVKRWMILVVLALVPCTLMAVWNTGLQSVVYGSGNAQLMGKYLTSSLSFKGYFAFAFSDELYLKILGAGLRAFLPVVFLSYLVGGLVEAVFAIIRGHEISEGFLVSGILFALILPPTIPYWMVAVGVASGIILGKEVFGGSGMNILNPALTCRCLLFFAYPTKMSGDIWVGTNPTKIKQSLLAIDSVSQTSPLGFFNIPSEIKRIHVDAIASQFTEKLSTLKLIKIQFAKWSQSFDPTALFGKLSPEQLENFVTTSLEKGGLGLAPENFLAASQFANLKHGLAHFGNGQLFFGNIVGSMGETSTLACLLGAFVLIYTAVGSWRSMLSMLIGGLSIAALFHYFSTHFGIDGGAWNPAKFDFPAYKHLLLGSFAFGLVFMITDPVSSPGLPLAKWIYGLLVGAMVIVIRVINPAFPEGVMLAILFGNVFAPLFDHYALGRMRRRRYARAKQ